MGFKFIAVSATDEAAWTHVVLSLHLKPPICIYIWLYLGPVNAHYCCSGPSRNLSLCPALFNKWLAIFYMHYCIGVGLYDQTGNLTGVASTEDQSPINWANSPPPPKLPNTLALIHLFYHCIGMGQRKIVITLITIDNAISLGIEEVQQLPRT